MTDLEFWAVKLKIKNFRGVFMRNALPESPHKFECGIVNLDTVGSFGTHWTCYAKNGKHVVYFDSYGNAPPPFALRQYLQMDEGIMYNSYGFQDYDDPPICGHLCLEVLRRYSNNETYNNIEDALRINKYVWKTWFR